MMSASSSPGSDAPPGAVDWKDSRAVDVAKAKHALNKAVEHLIGIVSGVVADAHLANSEIQFLSTWIAANSQVTQTWPGFLVARKVDEVMADGVITEKEREHLLDVLRQLAATDFSLTGSASPEVASLPINDIVTIEMRNAGLCLTGQFLYGTRASCERLSLRGGAMPLDSVSRSTDILVIGTRVSPNWAHTSFGRKIQKAVQLQEGGHPIEIISERRWLEALH